MFTIKVKGKPNPKNSNLVKLELVIFQTNYPRVTKVLDITGQYKDWNPKSQLFRSGSPDAYSKNRSLSEICMRYQRVAEEWTTSGRLWSPVELSHCFDRQQFAVQQDIRIRTVSQLIDERIAYFDSKERIKNGQIIVSCGTARGYRKIFRSLKAFTTIVYGKSLSSYFFKDIDAKFVTDYAFYLKRRGAENGNRGCLVSNLRLLRALCNYAAKLGMPGAGITAFDSLGDMIKWPETTSRAVSAKTIALLENIDRSLFSDREQLHLDLFLFSYYTGGMANIDVCNLTWDCVQEDKIVYERIKFPKTAVPLLIPQSQALLRKYKGTGYGNYVFPVFTRKHTDSVKRNTRVRDFSKSVSRTLAKACRILKIKEHVTWYSARGSFISRMVDDGNSPYAVAEMAGNSPITIWKNYYKNTEREKLAERMRAVL